MMNRLGVALIALGLLTGSGEAGSEYVGKWVSQKDSRVSLEITQDGDKFNVSRIAPSLRADHEDNVQYTAILADDGILKVQNPWGAISISVDEKTGRLTDGEIEYIKK